MFDKIGNLSYKKGVEVDKNGINSNKSYNKKGKEKYGKTKIDAYGDILRSVTVKQLSEVFNEHGITGWKNKAVAAYVKRLPPGLQIFLYWH